MSGNSWILQPPDHNIQLAPSWVSSFKTRNTFQILYSCIFTFILSAWTMLHPGIPNHAQRHAKWAGAKLFWERVKLALVALLLPEFMLLMAFLEYIRARQTRTIFSKFEERYPRPKHSPGTQAEETLQNTDPEAGAGSETLQKISQWKKCFQYFYPENLERGYYACMGGFELHGNIAEQKDDVHTLPPNIVAVLIAFGIAPDVSPEEINDKSKAERFTKLIACLQAMWMVIQVLTRKAVGLPITLLEFNAVMHIVCALVTYWLWFRKPKDIYIPTPIKQDDATGLIWQIRYLLSISGVHDTSQQRLPPNFLRPTSLLQYTRERDGKEGGGRWSLINTATKITRDLWKVGETMDQDLPPWTVQGISIVEPTSDQVFADTTPLMTAAQDEKPDVSTTECEPHTDAKHQMTELISTLVSTPSAPKENPDTQEILITFDRAMQVNHEWAKFVVEYCLDDTKGVGPTNLPWAEYCKVAKESAVLAQPLGDWGWLFSPTEENIQRAIQNPMTIYSGVTWIFLSAIYGGIHLAPWNSYFPTLLERYMWRFSGVTIIGGAPLFFLLSLIGLKVAKHSNAITTLAFPPKLKRFFENNDSRAGGMKLLCALLMVLSLPLILAWAFALVIVLCVFALGLFCALFGIIILSACARLYMIAEGFASLRSLPNAAYDNIDWLDIYPHF